MSKWPIIEEDEQGEDQDKKIIKIRMDIEGNDRPSLLGDAPHKKWHVEGGAFSTVPPTFEDFLLPCYASEF